MNKQQLIDSLKEKGFSKEILKAFSNVKRENFISETKKNLAYEDTALSIGEEQTISQPYTIAMMFSLLELRKNQKVLEVGSGCGYVLALISEITGKKGKVFGIERIKELYEKSIEHLKNYKNIKVYNQDGSLGLEKEAPFDRIIISAACEKIPNALINQLKDNGIIVAPINTGYGGQTLTAFKKIKGKLKIIEEIPGFVFVAFIEDK